DLNAAGERHEIVAAHLYPLERYRQEAERMLGYEAEALAAALDASGGSAWAKLYNDLTSRERILAAVTQEEVAGEGPQREYGTAELRSLQASPSEDVRRRAYSAELELLGRNQLTFAAAMNGIKGQVGSLARQRGWGGPLDYSLFQHGISRRSLDAMHQACEERFATLRGYLKAKAQLLGKDRLAWYDLFAPLPQAAARRFTWEEAQAVVLDRFATYSAELASFADRAFRQGWIDVPPRRGKRGGAFCSPVPVRDESRVMLNFGGNLSDVFTLAHELGHAYHNDCKFRFGRTVLQTPTPMTLSETASIFCETLLFDGLMTAAEETERLALLEQNLQHSTQLLLDIHTRFLFEAEVFDKRAERDLSAEEMSAVMVEAQARVFADAIAEDVLHPLMWAHKPHYYSSARSFYNFPYTFGWLFGLGLYARYEAEGYPFRRRYDELLASTGLAAASDLASGFGIDIEDPQFWRDSLGVIARRVDAFLAITAGSEG
ncbi:MAG TPA: M3 family metallopeptidase, partial [Trueperaceae bacterium]